MIQPIHMPGPVRVSDSTFTQLPGENLPRWELRVSLQASVAYAHREEDARLLAAAYNAFDSAAKKLGCNAVELAEAMRDGELLSEILSNSDLILYHTPHLDRAAFEKVTAIFAKVKGDAP